MSKMAHEMLLDIDGMDFVADEDVGAEGEPQFSFDPVSNAPMVPFPSMQQPDHEKLHFKFAPVLSRSFAFNGGSQNGDLYGVQVPYVDNSKEFSQYAAKLFEVYKSLGADKQFAVPTIGLINHTSTLEHNQTVNLALEAIVSELELFIESLKYSGRQQRLVDLEECLSILNCLKTVQFTLDSEEQNSRAKFIDSLISWVNRTDGEPSEAVIAKVLGDGKQTPILENPYFWRLLCQLIIRGLFDQAVAAIEKSELLSHVADKCSATHTMVQDMVNLLQGYPRESEPIYREWKDLVLQLHLSWSQSEQKISTELASSLEDCLLIMCGNKSKIIYYSKTWYECYCGLMLYYIPSLQLSEEYLQLVLKEHPLDVTSPWEQACVSIITGKIYSILPVLDSLDSCTAAFTAAICEAKGLLENDLLDDGGLEISNTGDEMFGLGNTMASYLLNQFALSIVTYEDKTLWAVAIGIIYLTPNYSDAAKRMMIAELLPHYPFQTNDDIEWMLTICAKWKLPQIARTIYRVLGQEALYLNNIIEAISNFSKAGEFEWVKHYSWMIFEASILQGAPLEDEVVNSIVTGEYESAIPKELVEVMVTPAMKQSLSPYAVLFNFYRATEDGRWVEALELLLSLIEFTYLPPQYLILLLGRFLYPLFLEDDGKMFKEQDVLRVIKALEQFHDRPDEITTAMYKELLVKVDTLPQDPLNLINAIRTKLSLKLCHQFM
ncbi:AaceriAEL073Cp [[Ashbya] aceris (nom. inval.)]|nr:AaceriAEL073Cp [[Ashbya] aceris (nom. inval.)]